MKTITYITLIILLASCTGYDSVPNLPGKTVLQGYICPDIDSNFLNLQQSEQIYNNILVNNYSQLPENNAQITLQGVSDTKSVFKQLEENPFVYCSDSSELKLMHGETYTLKAYLENGDSLMSQTTIPSKIVEWSAPIFYGTDTATNEHETVVTSKFEIEFKWDGNYDDILLFFYVKSVDTIDNQFYEGSQLLTEESIGTITNASFEETENGYKTTAVITKNRNYITQPYSFKLIYVDLIAITMSQEMKDYRLALKALNDENNNDPFGFDYFNGNMESVNVVGGLGFFAAYRKSTIRIYEVSEPENTKK